MANLKPPPLFLTPQVTRGLLGIGHPKRVADIEVKGAVNAADQAKPGLRGGGSNERPDVNGIG